MFGSLTALRERLGPGSALGTALATASLATVLLSTLGTLVVAFALKSYCLTDWQPGAQPKSCYNDIQTLWHQREMDQHEPPYSGEIVREVDVEGRTVAIVLGAGQIEYPVITGVFAWVTALAADGHAGYLIVSALALSPFALLSALALYRVAGPRSMLFALSPQLAAYAFLNWDLLTVAAVAGALWAWRRDRTALAGTLLSLGACAKIWPGFVVLPLLLAILLDRRAEVTGRVARAARMLAATVGTAVAVNLPFMINNLEGWSAPYLMQSVRANDRTTNSVWWMLFGPTEFGPVTFWSSLAVLGGWAAIIVVGLRRWRAGHTFPAVQVAAAMVCSYIYLGKVDSPQYGLWLVPFLVAVAVPGRVITVFAVTDIGLWLTWSWLWGLPGPVYVALIVTRVAALVWLTVVFLRSPSLLEPPPAAAPGRDGDVQPPDAARLARNPDRSTQASTTATVTGAIP